MINDKWRNVNIWQTPKYTVSRTHVFFQQEGALPHFNPEDVLFVN